MKHGKTGNDMIWNKKKKTDLIFAGIALTFLVLMILLLVQYNKLRSQNQARPEEYGSVMQELNDVKTAKNDLESKIDAALREIGELNKKISSLSGN